MLKLKDCFMAQVFIIWVNYKQCSFLNRNDCCHLILSISDLLCLIFYFFFTPDLLNWDVTFEAGDSRIEPGAVPARNTTYHFKSLSQFETECGQSRLWAGVHFQDAIDSIKPIAREVAKLAFNFVKKHANAEKPVHPYPNPGPHSPGPHHPEPHHPGPLHSHDPLTINELPPNPFSKPYQSPAYPGYNK